MARIYFDNAATSWPKPESVYRAVDHAMRELGAAVGRGGYREGIIVNQKVEATRELIANYVQASARRNIVFTYSCTDALNTAILGLLQPGDHVVSSVVEHNSVLRPLKHLELTQAVCVTHVGCNSAGVFHASDVIESILPETKLVVLSHGSNVTGAIQDLAPIGKYCQQTNIPFLIDAAQSIGHLPIDVQDMGCDLLAAAGHKGLLGPLGTGFLYISDRIAERLSPLRYGGTGSSQITHELPTAIPEKFEAGNLNMPGILGLAAGLNFLRSSEGRDLQAQLVERSGKLLKALTSLTQVAIFGPQDPPDRLPVFSLQVGQLDCHETAAIFESRWLIQTRAGLHCAPLLHQILGTDGYGGTVRISVGLFNTDSEIDKLLNAIESVAMTV